MKKTSIALVILLLLMLTSCSSGSSSKQYISGSSFEEYVENCEYSKAISDYQNNIAGNSEKELAASEFFESYINENLEKYENGKISDDEMQAIVDCYLKIDDELSLLNVKLGSIIEEFSAVKLSREYYDKATTALENGDYEEALEYLTYIDPADVQSYGSVTAKITEIKKQYCDSLIDEANILISENQYAEAYEQFSKGIPTLEEYDDYCSFRDKLEEMWVNYAIAEAETAFGDGADCEAAIDILNQVSIPSEKIDSEIARYREYTSTASDSTDGISKIIDKYFDAAKTNDLNKIVAVFPQDIVNECYGGGLKSNGLVAASVGVVMDDIEVYGETMKNYSITSFNSLTSSDISSEKASEISGILSDQIGYEGAFDDIAEVVVEAEFENADVGTTKYEFICVKRDGVWELWYVDDTFDWMFK